MTIAKKCPKCGIENVCITVKIGEIDVWLDCCYHCGKKLIEEKE